MAEPVVERDEIVGLLFNVSDIAASLRNIERLLRRDDGKRKRLTDADRRRLDRMGANAERTRELAEKALAQLPEATRAERERAGSNAAWLR